MSDPVIDGHAVDITPPDPPHQATTAAALVHQPVAVPAIPEHTAADLVSRLSTIREAQETAMVKDVDYGVIPGTNKPTLLKPGAEKLGVLFQLDVQVTNEKRWGPGDHLTVLSHATVHHAATGARLGYGEGVCSTRERKYAYRQQNRTCPSCGKDAIIKGKAEYGGGWLCFKKKDGCGATFGDTDQAIIGQATGEIDNPDLPDLWNTVVKMAQKRARVDAVLAVTGASALFTQDAEDFADHSVGDTPAAAPVELPAWARPVKPEAEANARQALARLIGPDPAAALLDAVKQYADGMMPNVANRLVLGIVARLPKTPSAPETGQGDPIPADAGNAAQTPPTRPTAPPAPPTAKDEQRQRMMTPPGHLPRSIDLLARIDAERRDIGNEPLTPVDQWKVLVDHGCTCPNPLDKPGVFDDECVFPDHRIPW